jgi:hypothetical protein
MIVNHSSVNIWELYKIGGVSLEPNKHWSFKLVSFIGKFSSQLPHSGIYELSTNLINRDGGNQSGVIGFIYLNTDESFVIYQPTQICGYKLRLPDLEYSLFNLRSVRSDVFIPFVEIALQIEIVEIYGGI